VGRAFWSGLPINPHRANRGATCIPELQNASECAFYCVNRHSVYALGGCVPTLRGQRRNPSVYSLQIFHHQVRVSPRHLKTQTPENPRVPQTSRTESGEL
jgi:hypothetical protein